MIKRDKIIRLLEEKIGEAIFKIENAPRRSLVKEYYRGKKKAYKEAIEIIKEAFPESLAEFCKNIKVKQ